MALISGLPNFATQPTAVAADFNNAAKAIVQQTGGEYYDQGSVAYVQSPGNLDSTNVAASPNLKNSQKAESFGYFQIPIPVGIVGMTSRAGTLETLSIVTTWSGLPVIPPLGIPYEIMSIHFAFGGTAAGIILSAARCTANGGSTSGFPVPALSIFLNDSQVVSITPGVLPESAGKVANDPTHYQLNLQVGPMDSVTIDISQLIVAVTAVTTEGGAGSDSVLEIALMCKTPHIRAG